MASAHPEFILCLTVSFSPVVSLQDDSSVSSEEMNSAEPTWVATEQPPVPEPSPPNGDRVSNSAANVKEEDGMKCFHLFVVIIVVVFTSGFCW